MTYIHPSTLPTLLQTRLVALQQTHRLPATAAAIGRNGSLLFTSSVGAPPPEPDTQFRIGSISKTFTAVLIMQLRDEGRLTLDDRLDQHIGGSIAGHLTVRALLSHRSGLTAEPRGPFWEATGRTRDELLNDLDDDDLVLPPNQTFHYSNVGFALLGQVVEKLREQSWADVLHDRLLGPLELNRTSYAPTAPFAQGYRVHPYANTLTPEPYADTDAMAPAGQLWSTPTDLVRWGTFLARPVPEILHPDTVEEMATPTSMTDPKHWVAGYGLGLDIVRYGEQLVIGHSGSMPGFSARLSVAREANVVAAIVTNAWGGRQGTFVQDAIESTLAAYPLQHTWQTENVPDDLVTLLGTWWYRGLPITLSCRDGALWMGETNDPQVRFEQLAPDTFRAASGQMRGETLRVVRDEHGTPTVLDLNTWLLVRSHDDPRGGP